MTHIQQRRDDSTVWEASNPIPYVGEACHEEDTGRWKLGDGITPYNDLPYKSGVDSVAGKTGIVSLVVADVEGAAPTVNPAFTGTPTAPTPVTTDNDTSIATTAFVKAQLVDTPLTGYPTAPTPPLGDNDVSVATTAYVKGQFMNTSLVGTPTAPTPAKTDNDTSVATTAFVKSLELQPLGHYDGNLSLIPFGGFPANNVRYTVADWTLAIPTNTQYAMVHLTCDAYANGPNQMTWWMAVLLNPSGAYADVMTSVHTNGGVAAINLPANLLTNVHTPDGKSELRVRLAGQASSGSGFAPVNAGMANVHVTFMGFPA